jgi:hypothetical protein
MASRPARYCSTRTLLSAVAFTFGTEIVMSEDRNAGVQRPAGTVVSGTPQRGDVIERGLLIGGKSVPASSGQFAEDVCPWDGEIWPPSPRPGHPHNPRATGAPRAVNSCAWFCMVSTRHPLLGLKHATEQYRP